MITHEYPHFRKPPLFGAVGGLLHSPPLMYTPMLGTQWDQPPDFRGSRRKRRIDLVTFSLGISACEKATAWQQALRLFRDIGVVRLEPNVVSYGGMLLGTGKLPKVLDGSRCAGSKVDHRLSVLTRLPDKIMLYHMNRYVSLLFRVLFRETLTNRTIRHQALLQITPDGRAWNGIAVALCLHYTTMMPEANKMMCKVIKKPISKGLQTPKKWGQRD